MKKITYKIITIFPKLAVKLSGGSFFSMLRLYFQFVYSSVVWKLKRKKVFTFAFEFQSKKFILNLVDSTDVAALEEIYINGEYNWNLPEKPRTILDLGANYGDTALYYHAVYPDAIVYAVEASPNSYNRLCEHTKDIPNIVPIHAAVADVDGSIDLYLMNESSLGNSLMKRLPDMEKVTVPAMTLGSLVAIYNQGKTFDLIKFDIEGAEEKMYKNCLPEDCGAAYTGELHYDLMDLSPQDINILFLKFNFIIENLNSNHRVIIRAIVK